MPFFIDKEKLTGILVLVQEYVLFILFPSPSLLPSSPSLPLAPNQPCLTNESCQTEVTGEYMKEISKSLEDFKIIL